MFIYIYLWIIENKNNSKPTREIFCPTDPECYINVRSQNQTQCVILRFFNGKSNKSKLVLKLCYKEPNEGGRNNDFDALFWKGDGEISCVICAQICKVNWARHTRQTSEDVTVCRLTTRTNWCFWWRLHFVHHLVEHQRPLMQTVLEVQDGR